MCNVAGMRKLTIRRSHSTGVGWCWYGQVYNKTNYVKVCHEQSQSMPGTS